jgi:hypothetical protein
MSDVVEAGELAVVEVAEPEKEWHPDRAITRAALAEIDAIHSTYPKCVVCGQRCIRLDRYGCCSKVSERSEPHRQHRNEMKGVRA